MGTLRQPDAEHVVADRGVCVVPGAVQLRDAGRQLEVRPRWLPRRRRTGWSRPVATHARHTAAADCALSAVHVCHRPAGKPVEQLRTGRHPHPRRARRYHQCAGLQDLHRRFHGPGSGRFVDTVSAHVACSRSAEHRSVQTLVPLPAPWGESMIERHRLLDTGAYLLLTLGLVFALGPLYVAVCSATVSNPQLFAHGLALIPGDQLLENLQQVTRRLDLLRLLGNSLLVATLVVIGKLTLSALTAFAVVYFRSRYTSVIFFAVLGALLLPLEVRIIPTYAVASDLLGPLRNLLQWLGIQWLPVPTINLLDSY
ncbi:sn-glycerol-3-phosphate transport system permease protein, partial [Pseudomonas savastanoi]